MNLSDTLIEFVTCQGADEDVVATIEFLPVWQHLVPRWISHDDIEATAFSEEHFWEFQFPMKKALALIRSLAFTRTHLFKSGPPLLL